MKKLVVALTALAAFSGSAVAADMAPRYSKAAPMAVASPIYSWTGFYIFGGGGYGLFDSEDYTKDGPNTILSTNNRQGGHGYFGTVGGGYDMQFGSWVAGVFADAQFGSIRGSIIDLDYDNSGTYKNRTNVAAGGRIGYLIAPNVLSYVNGGYSYAEFSGSNLNDTTFSNTPTNTHGFHRNGWFLGGGVENSLGLLGAGWFMKTEYRVAEYERGDVGVFNPDGTPFINGSNTFQTQISTKPIVQTISTSLVYRFNWGGPVVAKY